MLFKPAQEITEQSYVKDYEKLYREVQADPEAFWDNIAHELLWFKLWDKVLDWKFPYARWFVGGQTNIVYNALDRHQKTQTKEKLALIWEGQDGEVRKYTFGELNDEVCRFANGLKSLGIKKGDRVTIYLPRIPEQFIAMLACAKIGAVHSVVFSGFSSEALKNRILDAQARVLICANAYPYGKKVIESKKNVDEAIKDLPLVEHVIVVKRMKNISVIASEAKQSDEEIALSFTPLTPRNDNSPQYHWWHELTVKQDDVCSTEIMESNDPLFILYTSGTTGKPKGIIHAHGGYMVGIYLTYKWVFDIQPDDIYWCTADAGWITGHSYIVYAPLINGVTTFVYEGTPDYPDFGKWWSLVEKYKITKFYTAPTAVRALMRQGESWPKKYNLSSLKILGTVGEPINPEAWLWYHKNIGAEKCPIMDTWWQTETGMFMITPVPSVDLKPGSAFKPFFGVEADVVDEKGSPVAPNTEGYLIIKTPWPAMFLDVYGDPERYKETYFAKIPPTNKGKNFTPLKNGSNVISSANEKSQTEISHFVRDDGGTNRFSDFIYFTGDSAKRDEDGYYWIIGRNDDVIKVSGHRLGSAELESAFVAHPAVAEAAVIGKPDEIKGESIKAYVILKVGQKPSDQLKDELKQEVRKQIGPIATPDEIEFVDKLPKTRSGKIMRRVLKAQELGLPVGDTSTLES